MPRSPAVFGVLHLQLVASVALKSSATPWQKHGKYRHQGSSPPAQGMAHEFMEANATIGRNNPAIPLPTKSNAQISLVSQAALTLRDVGREADAQAWQESLGIWEDAQAEQERLNDGWAAVRTARDDGQAALAVALSEQHAQEQTRAWRSLEQDLQALAAQLDRLGEESAGRGSVRIRLWDRDQGLGL